MKVSYAKGVDIPTTTFGEIKNGQLFLDPANFSDDTLFMKVYNSPDGLLNEQALAGGGAAVELNTGAIYFYDNSEIIKRAEGEATITKVYE